MSGPTWGWDVYDNLTYDLILSIPSSSVHFKFEQAVKSMEKRCKKLVDIPKKIEIPDKFMWYIRRQSKRLIVLPHASMERDGYMPYASKVVDGWYDTSNPKDWVLNIKISGKYKLKNGK